MNLKPIKLWQFDLETDHRYHIIFGVWIRTTHSSLSSHRKYAMTAVSLARAMKSRMIGSEDFSISDAMTSEHDLQYASKNFKFGLVPKVRVMSSFDFDC